MTRVMLVNPPESSQRGYSGPPLGLLYLAGTLRKEGHDVRVVDGYLDGWESAAREIRGFRPQIVGVTCLTPERKKAIRVARMAKGIDPGITVVAGGAHPTILYRQLLESYPEIDVAVLGEGELALAEIAAGRSLETIDGIAFRQHGAVTSTRRRTPVADLDAIPFPAWDLAALSRYPAIGTGVHNGVDLSKVPRVSVVFSRGCVGHCTFCSSWWIWRGWRRRSPENMLAEIELLHDRLGIRHLCFADDAFSVDQEAAIRLAEGIVSRKWRIAFHVTTRPDCVGPELLSRLREAGCYQIAYGVETGSEDILKTMNKKNLLRASVDAIRWTREAGIRATALLIVGNVGETHRTINDTVAFLDEAEPDDLGMAGSLWVLPGTKLHADLEKGGVIDQDFWLGDEPYMTYSVEHGAVDRFLFTMAVLERKRLSGSRWRDLARFAPAIARRGARRLLGAEKSA